MSRKAVTLRSLILFLALALTMSVSYAQDRFSEEEFFTYMVEKEVRFPHIVYAQAALESGNFTSTIFRENNNLFGMRMPERRETTAVGINRKYAVYSTWKSSVDDYLLFQQRYLGQYQTEAGYLKYLDRNYCECEGYVNKLKSRYPNF